MELGLLVVFLYGVLHALAPDHLIVIANFSIGQQIKKAMLVTLLFALGHGLTLLLFAYLLQSYTFLESFIQYGDTIAALMIILMGSYLLYLVFNNRIFLHRHRHSNTENSEAFEHIHVSFSKQHQHHKTAVLPVISFGVLMGLGGLRGMLASVGVAGQELQMMMLVWFVLGVSVVFMVLGGMIYLVNRNLSSLTAVKRIFATLGLGSIVIGGNLLIGG